MPVLSYQLSERWGKSPMGMQSDLALRGINTSLVKKMLEQELRFVIDACDQCVRPNLDRAIVAILHLGYSMPVITPTLRQWQIQASEDQVIAYKTNSLVTQTHCSNVWAILSPFISKTPHCFAGGFRSMVYSESLRTWC